MVFCQLELVNFLIDPYGGPVDPIRPFEGGGDLYFEIPTNPNTEELYGVDPSTTYPYFNQILYEYLTPLLS